MAARGERRSRSISFSRTIYVSSAGRFFAKGTEGSRSGAAGPGDRTPAGDARDLRFSGGKLVGLVQRGAGAARMIVNFDSSFSSCSVHLTYGNPVAEHPTTTAPDGSRIQILSVSFSGESCSIRDGNAVAD